MLVFYKVSSLQTPVRLKGCSVAMGVVLIFRTVKCSLVGLESVTAIVTAVCCKQTRFFFTFMFAVS